MFPVRPGRDRSWARKVALVGLVIFCLGLLWLWNRSMNGPVVAGILGAGALLMLGGIGEEPVPFPLHDVPVQWGPWRRRLAAWMFVAGLALAGVSAVLALTLAVTIGAFVALFAGGVAVTGTSILLSGDALAFRTHDNSGDPTSGQIDFGDDGTW